MPKRIQRKRTKGWRMPEGAIYVGRATMFGNPFTVGGCRSAGYSGSYTEIQERCVGAFRAWLTSKYWRENWDSEESGARRNALLGNLHTLSGHDLVCWCALDYPCHADVLLSLANDLAFLAGIDL